MEFDGDDLAGVVDLFGGLTRPELGQALSELAYRAGEEADPEDYDDTIRRAVDDYYLVAVEAETAWPLLVPGPVAFPSLPPGANDLPHILDVETRTVDRERAARRVAERLREEAAELSAEGASARAADLLNVTYDAEAWAALDLADVRETLDGT